MSYTRRSSNSIIAYTRRFFNRTCLTVLLKIACLLTCFISTAHSQQSCPVMDTTYCQCQSLSSSTSITCFGLGVLTSVPQFTAADPNTLYSVSFRGLTKILNIQPNAFAGLAVITLDLESIGVRTVAAGAFAGLTSMTGPPPTLTQLDLNDNNIVDLPASVFAGMFSLITLNLQANNLRSLFLGLFADLVSLQNLNIGGNELTTIPDQLFWNQSAILTLSIDHNVLTTLTDLVFSHQTSLTSLSLNDNRISSLSPSCFGSLSKLSTLSLANNEIVMLNVAQFSSLASLKKLDLSGNLISNIETNMFIGLNGLTNLVLKINSITTLPADAFSQLNGLTNLDLSQNLINGLPDAVFSNQVALTTLLLSTNYLTSIDSKTFQGLFQLTTLYLRDNSIQTISVDAFSLLSKLSTIDLTGNSLTTLTPGTFQSLSVLNYIYLASNRIASIPTGLFRNLPRASSIILSNNFITQLSANAFQNLTILAYLDLSNNQIAKIDNGAFNAVPTMNTLYLTGNRLTDVPKQALMTLASKLGIVQLDSNLITTVPANAFTGVTKYMVTLASNRLSTLDVSAFQGAIGFTQIVLKSNNLTDIPDNTFSYTSSSQVTSLDISYNLLTHLRQAMFRGLTSKSLTLDLTGNLLTSLDNGCFDAMTGLTTLRLGLNSLLLLSGATFGGSPVLQLSLTSLNISYNLFSDTSLPALSNLSLIRTLVLDGNSIVNPTSDSLSGLNNLVSLSLRNNSLRTFNLSLTQSVSLTTLDLGLNQLTSNTAIGLAAMSSLTSLKLDSNQFSTLKVFTTFIVPSTVLQLDVSNNVLSDDSLSPLTGLTGLTKLTLDGNQITNLAGIQGLSPTLATLSVKRNGLTSTVFVVLANFTSLTELDLENNLIGAIPNDFFLNKLLINKFSITNNRLTTINQSSLSGFEQNGQYLYLSGNGLQITDIKTFEYLSNLKELDLSNNALTSLTLPPLMTSLQRLSLNLNSLVRYPDNLYSSTVINYVNMSSNQLTNLPAILFRRVDSTTAIMLDVSNNQLVSINNFGLVGSFHYVNLSSNYLLDISSNVLSGAVCIQTIDLSLNLFTSIPQSIAESASKITNLTLASNYINSIDAAWNENSTNGNLRSGVKTLNISNNNLKNITTAFTSALSSSLVTLDLRQNLLTTLPSFQSVQNLIHVQTLLLVGNLWNCDCQLSWVRDLAFLGVYVDYATCVSGTGVTNDTLVVCYDISGCGSSTSVPPDAKCSMPVNARPPIFASQVRQDASQAPTTSTILSAIMTLTTHLAVSLLSSTMQSPGHNNNSSIPFTSSTPALTSHSSNSSSLAQLSFTTTPISAHESNTTSTSNKFNEAGNTSTSSAPLFGSTTFSSNSTHSLSPNIPTIGSTPKLSESSSSFSNYTTPNGIIGISNGSTLHTAESSTHSSSLALLSVPTTHISTHSYNKTSTSHKSNETESTVTLPSSLFGSTTLSSNSTHSLSADVSTSHANFLNITSITSNTSALITSPIIIIGQGSASSVTQTPEFILTTLFHNTTVTGSTPKLSESSSSSSNHTTAKGIIGVLNGSTLHTGESSSHSRSIGQLSLSTTQISAHLSNTTSGSSKSNEAGSNTTFSASPSSSENHTTISGIIGALNGTTLHTAEFSSHSPSLALNSSSTTPFSTHLSNTTFAIGSNITNSNTSLHSSQLPFSLSSGSAVNYTGTTQKSSSFGMSNGSFIIKNSSLPNANTVSPSVTFNFTTLGSTHFSSELSGNPQSAVSTNPSSSNSLLNSSSTALPQSSSFSSSSSNSSSNSSESNSTHGVTIPVVLPSANLSNVSLTSSLNNVSLSTNPIVNSSSNLSTPYPPILSSSTPALLVSSLSNGTVSPVTGVSNVFSNLTTPHTSSNSSTSMVSNSSSGLPPIVFFSSTSQSLLSSSNNGTNLSTGTSGTNVVSNQTPPVSFSNSTTNNSASYPSTLSSTPQSIQNSSSNVSTSYVIPVSISGSNDFSNQTSTVSGQMFSNSSTNMSSSSPTTPAPVSFLSPTFQYLLTSLSNNYSSTVMSSITPASNAFSNQTSLGSSMASGNFSFQPLSSPTPTGNIIGSTNLSSTSSGIVINSTINSTVMLSVSFTPTSTPFFTSSAVSSTLSSLIVPLTLGTTPSNGYNTSSINATNMSSASSFLNVTSLSSSSSLPGTSLLITTTTGGGSGGLSQRDKIILGVVLGVGGFLILLAIIGIIFCWKCTNCMRGKKDGRYEVAKEFTVMGGNQGADNAEVGQSNV